MDRIADILDALENQKEQVAANFMIIWNHGC